MSDVYTTFSPFFRPRVLAVAGASSTRVTPGNEFIRHSRALGFEGRIVPIHPTADTIEGLPTARSFADVGEIVDFVYVAVKADDVPALIATGAGLVRYALVMSSGFGEIEGGHELERRLMTEARAAGVRVVGPNCLGVYSPRGRMSFIGGLNGKCGSVGIVTQSGGLAADVILRGQNRGLAFSAAVTLGNSVDVSATELIEYFLIEPDTKVVGLYVEDIKDGRGLFRALRAAHGAKPIVVLIGGQTSQGSRAAASHTGSLVSRMEIWRGLARQTGIVIVETLDEWIDVLLAFQTLSPRNERATRRCVLFGNGGGISVLASDAFGRRGLNVEVMPQTALDALKALRLPPGTSISNPIDTSALALRQENGAIAERILDVIFEHGHTDAVVMHLNLPMFMASANQSADFLQNLVNAAIRVRARHTDHVHFVLVLRSDGSEACERRRRDFRGEAVQRGIPVYDEIVGAADALAGMAFFERYMIAERKEHQTVER